MNVFILSAAALAAVWTLVHGIVGGRQCARPLAADKRLIPVVRETVLLCWHLVTGALALMALFLCLGAFGRTDMALAGILLAAVTAGIGIAWPPLRGVS